MSQIYNQRFLGVLLVAACTLGHVGVAAAESCLPGPAAAPTALMDAFRADPSKTLLVDLPLNRLSSTVRQIVGSDTTLAPQIVRLLAGLPADRSGPIGEGLGLAALGCTQNYPRDAAKQLAATEIQQALARSENVFALASYNSAAQNNATAAVDGAAAGGTLGSAANGQIPTGGPNLGELPSASRASRTSSPGDSGASSSGSGTLPAGARRTNFSALLLTSTVPSTSVEGAPFPVASGLPVFVTIGAIHMFLRRRRKARAASQAV